MIWRSRRFSVLIVASLGVMAVGLVGGRPGLAQDLAAQQKAASQVTAPAISAALSQGNAPGVQALVKGRQTTSIFQQALNLGLKNRDLQLSRSVAPKLIAAAAAPAAPGDALLRTLTASDVDAAVRVGLKRLTGLNPPPEGLRVHAVLNDGETRMLADAPRPRQPGDPDPSQSVGDWRQARVIMLVADQGRKDGDERNQGRGFNNATGKYDLSSDCGCCWAFGTIGAFEHAYAVRFNEFINISEQELLNFADPNYGCNGGWWAFDYLLTNPISSESQHRYTGGPDGAAVAQPRFKAAKWGYVTTASEIPTVPALKQALCEYGPLAVGVNATPNFANYLPSTLPDGVFTENDPGPINHAVLLVGWDDTKGGGSWVIRNSWGGDWGESGFMHIGYNTNRIGYGAAWVIPEKAAAPSSP